MNAAINTVKYMLPQRIAPTISATYTMPERERVIRFFILIDMYYIRKDIHSAFIMQANDRKKAPILHESELLLKKVSCMKVVSGFALVCLITAF